MKKNRQTMVTLLLLLGIVVILTLAAKLDYTRERQNCFGRLKEYTQESALDIRQHFKAQCSYLEWIAGVLTQSETENAGEVERLFSSLDDTEIFSRVELLLPGDKLLTKAGITDVSGVLSFADESRDGSKHISGRTRDPEDSKSEILRCWVPVKSGEDTVAMLCGVINLKTLPDRFTVEGYDGQTQLYIIEGQSGNFLMDTWHDKLGNISDLSDRSPKAGYSRDQVVSDFAAGKAGITVFRSEKGKDNFYSSYEPIGVQDWMVMITVPEKIAFAPAQHRLYAFYALSAVLLLNIVLYFIWVFRNMKKEKMSGEKQLKDIRFILDIEKELFDAHLHEEHFITALRKIADFLNAEAAFFWLADGLEDVRRRVWSSRDDTRFEQSEILETMLKKYLPVLEIKESLISYDMETLVREYPDIRRFISRFQIDSLMVLPVNGTEGNIAVVLGAYNMKKRWTSAEPLAQVGLSLSMALNHYGAHQTLIRMGQLDYLTGVMNRNSYHAALDELEEKEYDTAACIYIDVNGLHERNNQLGHQAGDEMLKAVADTLVKCFEEGDVYRIGGDEFVVLCLDTDRRRIYDNARRSKETLRTMDYDISVGIAYRKDSNHLEEMIRDAEQAMQNDKARYYKEKGQERRMRTMNMQLEQMLTEKKDADTFLTVLAPEFKGVYFVDLNLDKIRHLYIPPYFEECLEEAGDVFSKALLLYMKKEVRPEYYDQFCEICNYDILEKKIEGDHVLEFVYEKLDGEWVKLRILRFKDYTKDHKETLWIFLNEQQAF